MKTVLGEHTTRSDEETMALARALASEVERGDLVLLTGTLGAGKTVFVKGLASGMGIDPVLVHSPTFTLVADHHGPRRLGHVDLYRLEDSREIEELGIDDLRDAGAIVAVEWGERIPVSMKPGAIIVTIEVIAPDDRRIVIQRPDDS